MSMPATNHEAESAIKRQMAQQFCHDLAARPMIWGRLDCALALADWIKLQRGIDPADAFRGTYHSEKDALALVKRHGSFLSFMSELAVKSGLAETTAPESGDVAVVELGRRRRIMTHLDGAGAIMLGGLWTVKVRTGVLGACFDVLRAWRV